MIFLYQKNGNRIKAEIHKFSYEGTFLGECFISARIESDTPLDFEIGDYLYFRGEKFVLNYIPAKQKQARKGTHGSAFVYDNVKFNSLADELTRVEFLDVVPSDNRVHYSSLSSFSFYANNVNDLAGRIQANLDRVFGGLEKWTVEVSPEAATPDKNISVDKINCWEALALASSEFGVNFIIRNRRITIGTAGIAVGKVFGYGKGKGLVDIQQTTNADALIVTRLRAYGSTRNLPNRYYNKLKDRNGNQLVSDGVYIPNLMLPEFPYQIQDPAKVYLDSEKKVIYGLRESSVYFDGSDKELPDIFPSLEGMTGKQLADAGITVRLPIGDNGNIDEILKATNPTDNGLVPTEGEGEIPETFTIVLKDLGFDLSEKDKDGQYKYATSDTMQISMKSGMCIGRTFDILDKGITKNVLTNTTEYVIKCKRFVDDTIGGGTAYPNTQYQVKAGDKFVILGIDMPGVYVKTAAERLKTEAVKYLSEHDETTYTYTPKIDEIFMANNPQISDSIKEGDILNFDDTDLNIEASVIIQSLKISVGEKPVPIYEVTLSNERITGTIEKIQNAISQLAVSATGVTLEQVKSLILSLGTRHFLSRLKDDTAEGKITFLDDVSIEKDLTVHQSITAKKEVVSDLFGNDTFTSGQFGSGFRVWQSPINGQSYAEFDNLMVRRETMFNILTIAEIKSVGGQILVSPANMICSKAEEVNDNLQDSILKSSFSRVTYEKVNESEIIATFNGGTSSPYIFLPSTELKLDETYTLSFTATLLQFISGTNILRYGVRNSGNPDTSVVFEEGETKTITYTFKCSDITALSKLIIFTSSSSVYNIKDVKIEKGDRATSFVEGTGGYKCSFDTDNGTIYNQFAINDQAICRRFEGQKMKYYWRRVLSIGADYIILSKTDCDGGGVPERGDDVIQFGNRTNANRQSAIMISSYGSDSPSIKQYAGVNSYDLTDKEVTVISPSGNKFTGTFSVKTGNGSVRVPADRGIWQISTPYHYYDRVSYNGALWLCVIPEGQTTTTAPSDINTHWQKQVAEGQKGDQGEKGEQGLQGVAGKDGKDGVIYYTWIRYADTATGGGISNLPTGKTYIGLAYNKTTATESNNPADYKWSLIKGEKGDTGVEGAKGTDGKTYYTWIKYSDNADGTGLYDTPKDSTRYIGIAVNKETAAESINKADYTWSLFKGADGKDGRDGINGTNGINGSSSYFHVRYSPNANGNPMQTTPAKFIGTAVTQSMTAPTAYTAYTWFEWKGAQGADGKQGIAGTNGVDGKTSYLHIKYSNDGGNSFTTNGGEDVGDWIGQYVDFVQADSNDPKKYQWSRLKGDKGDAGTLNYIEWKDVWQEGSGVIAGWDNNGAATKNVREYGLNPFGITSLLWKCVPDATGNNSGGWNTTSVKLDPKYAYRYAVFVKKAKNGATYHGCYDVLNLNGTANGNPYFWNGSNLRVNEWFLMVGIVHPNHITANSGISGVYDMQGRKFANGTDYKFSPTSTSARFRSYLYYVTDPADLQYFYNPIVHRLDGTEPGIDELLQISTRKVVDTEFKILDDKISSKVSQTDFNSLQGRVSESESKIEQQAGQISSTVEKVDGKSSVYKSYTNVATDRPSVPYAKGDLWITYNGEIKQSQNTRLSGSFIDGDWKETTKYTDDSAVENLRIGGRNLVLNSGTISEIGGDGTANVEKIKYTGHFAELTAGETYTFSCETNGIWGNTGNTVEAFIMKDKVVASGQYMQMKTNPCTFVAPQAGKFYIRIDSNSGDKKYQFWNFKIEKGNKATDWTAAPEDIEAEIDNAQTSANTANNKLAEIANDNLLIPSEKQDTLKEWEIIKGEYPIIIAQANTYALATTDYTSKYNALNTYITPLLANLTANSTIAGTTFRTNFKNYYDAKISLLKLVTDKAKANIDQTNSAVVYGNLYCRGTGLNRSTNRVLTLNDKSIYNTGGRGLRVTVIKRTDLSVVSDKAYDIYNPDGVDRTNLATDLNSLNDTVIVAITSYDAINIDTNLATAMARCGGSGILLNGRHPYSLVGIPNIGKGNGIEVYFGQGATAPYAEITTKIINGIPQGISTTGGKALADAANAQTAADNAQTAANTANTKLSEIANDNILTPSEKQDTLKEWQIIQGEFATVKAQAATYGISYSTYETRYNTLNTYITPLLANLTVNSTIAGTTFRANFKNYYDAKIALLKLVTDKAKSVADGASELAKAMAYGKMLYKDPTFLKGNNSVAVYNNDNNGMVVINRIAKIAGTPTNSTHCLEIRTTGAPTSPNFGGFSFMNRTRANAKFICRFIAKIPSGFNVNWASNPIGTGGSSQWLTSQAGTGNWQEYICSVNCGSTGTFNDTNYFSLSGTFSPSSTNPLVWYLAYATVIDITDSEMNYEQAIKDAQDTANRKVRYIRDWLNGSTANTGNHWVQIMAFNATGTNIALNKNVLDSTDKRITNGNIDTNSYLNVAEGLKNVVVDLGEVYEIQKIKIWHYYADGRTYNATKTECSADGVNWFTVFDSAVQGRYKETSVGNLILVTDSAIKNESSTKNRTYYSDVAPTVPEGGHKTGDLWYKISLTDGCYTTYRWNGSSWVQINVYVSKSRIEQTDSRITSVVEKTGVNSLGNGETLFSKINQTADQIRLEVKNIQVGGRNLIPFTNMGTEGYSYTIQSGSGKWEEVPALGVRAARYTTSVASVGWHVLLHSINRSLIKNNTQYTISFDMLPTFDGTMGIEIRDGGGGNNLISWGTFAYKKSVWNKVVLSAISNSNTGINQQIYITGLNVVGNVTFANLQMEEGNKATSWSPSPEDIGQIAGSSLTLTDNKITLGAQTIELNGDTIAKAIQAQDLSVKTADGSNIFEVKNNGRFYSKSVSGNSSLEIDSQNRKIEFKNSRNIYTETNGNRAVTQTTKIDALSGTFQSDDSDYNSAYLSSQGIFANRAGISPYSASTGINLKAAVAGLGFGAMNKSYFSNWGLVGVFGRASNSASTNKAPAYGGWFDILRANGLVYGVRRISNSTTLTQNDVYVSCYNSSDINLYLPENPYEGTFIMVRRVNNSNIHIYGNGNQIHTDGNTVNDIWHKNGRGDTSIFIFDGNYWMFNYWVR